MGNQLIARWRWRGETTKLHPLHQEQPGTQDTVPAPPEENKKNFTRIGSIFRAASSARKSWRKTRNQRNHTGSNGAAGDAGDESFGAAAAEAAAAEEDLLPDGADDGIFRRRVHHFEKDTIKANWMNEGDIGSEPEGNQVRLVWRWFPQSVQALGCLVDASFLCMYPSNMLMQGRLI